MMFFLLACSGSNPDPVTVVEVNELSPTRLARRISLDVRGKAPTIDEYEAILADPTEMDALVGTWLNDPDFAKRVVALYSEIYLTRTDELPFSAEALAPADPAGFQQAVGEEPLQLLGYVAANDKPWTDIVTADYTIANDALANVFPIDLDDGTGWRTGEYVDGRPAAGVLSTTGMWWRYTSSVSNANRKRANQVSRILLCNDYLTRPVEFDRNVNLLDEGAVLDALSTDPACVSCHVSLDPLASYFYGFFSVNDASAIDASQYHPERERLWSELTGVSPGYYGEPGEDLRDLGIQIASDGRFVECATEQAYELLLRRDPAFADQESLTAHRQAFIEGGLTLKALFASIIEDPLYRADNSTQQGASSLRWVSPDLLASQVESLTGFRWTYVGYDMLTTDAIGLRTLAGGADGLAVTAVSRTPNATAVLVQQRLAELATAYLVDESPEPWLDVVDPRVPPNAETLARLVLALHGVIVQPDGPEVQALTELYADLETAEESPRAAWAGIVYALMRDPQFVLY